MTNKPKDIIAARIGSIITNDRDEIVAALQSGTRIEPIDSVRAKFMAACDLGPQWTALAQSPILFVLGEDGVYREPVKEAVT